MAESSAPQRSDRLVVLGFGHVVAGVVLAEYIYCERAEAAKYCL